MAKMKTDGRDGFRAYPEYPSDILDILIRINPLTPFTLRRIEQLRRTVLETRINIHNLNQRKQQNPAKRTARENVFQLPKAKRKQAHEVVWERGRKRR